MRLDFCVACGERDAAKLEHHHMIPRSAGGSDDATNLITLCHTCHGKFHGYERLHIRALSAAGVEAARARGVKIGNPMCHTSEGKEKLRAARNDARKVKVLKMADDIAPVIIAMRPRHTWEDVAAALNDTQTLRPGNAPWTPNALIRVAKLLVEVGIADAAILGRTPTFRPADSLIPVVANIVKKNPEASLSQIVNTLRAMGHNSPRGNAKWPKSSVKYAKDAAKRAGLLG